MSRNGPQHIVSLWEIHRDAPWPKLSDPHEGELMTLDTVISGCVTYYLESTEGLDAQRLEILESCQAELAILLPDLAPDVRDYFTRLSNLASLLLRNAGR